MLENRIICNCMNVSVADVEKVLDTSNKFHEVENYFSVIQEQTNCSTGCGGCYDDVMDTISKIIYD